MNDRTDNATAPDLATLTDMADAALAAVPDPFGSAARGIALRVAEFPSADMLDDLGIEDPFELTGLYDGIPLTEKSVFDQPQAPDTIWLFRRAILDEWVARGDIGLMDLVTHVLVHELAHHFGWSDDDIASIDRWWE